MIALDAAPKQHSQSVGGGVRLLLASAFGLGLSPIAPGTCGALLGVAVHLIIALFAPTVWQRWLLGGAFAAVCWTHFSLTRWAQQYWRESDPSHFVLDEVAGYLFVPLLVTSGDPWKLALWSFVCFRVLDIIKIPPARQVDRKMHGAVGILLDDLISAAYAAVLIYVLSAIAGRLGLGQWLVVTT